LGPKKSGEAFNQQDLRILRALRVRLENFLAQAMTITQEALNMVKDSHDMKNDIHALKGRVTWRAMRGAGWWAEFDKQFHTVNAAVGALPPDQRLAAESALAVLQKESRSLFEDMKKSGAIEDNALKRLAHRLKNWAEYGRVVSEGFKGQRQMEAVSVSDAVHLSIERWRPMAERKGVELMQDVSGAPIIWGERSLFEQIVENLIDNALKATEQGAVCVKAVPSGSLLQLEVSDSGCGIPPEHLESIFNRPFYQGKGRESMEQSTGIGLYLVAQYARTLGGTVSAESEMGKGSRFKVRLPLHQLGPERAGAAA